MFIGAAVLCAAVAFITYPVAFNPRKCAFGIERYPQDIFSSIYGLWLYKTGTSTSDWRVHIPTPNSADTGAGSIPRICLLGTDIIARALVDMCGDEVLAFNLMVLLGLLLTAYAAYALVFCVTKDPAVACAGGLMAVCSPPLVYHAMAGHVGFLFPGQYLFAYFLIRIVSDGRFSVVNTAGAVSGFLMGAATTHYFAYYTVLLFVFSAVYFIAGHFFSADAPHAKMKKILISTRALITGAAVTACVIAVIFIFWNEIEQSVSFMLKAWRYVLSTRTWRDEGMFIEHALNILRPPHLNPLVGRFVSMPSDYFEKTLYIGFIPVVCAAAYFTGGAAGRNKIHTKIGLFCMAVWAAFVVCSFPAVCRAGGFIFKMPSYYLSFAFPGFREYGRMIMFSHVFLVTAACLGMQRVTRGLRPRIKLLVVCLLCGASMGEYVIVPPFRTIHTGRVPEVYAWLAAQEKGGAVIECPMYPGIDERHYRYLFYQRIHRKKMLNGAAQGSFEEAVLRKLKDINNPSVQGALHYFGVRMAVVHQDAFNAPVPVSLPLLTKAQGIEVYGIGKQMPFCLSVPWGYDKIERAKKKTQWLSGTNKLMLWVVNGYGVPVQRSLSLSAQWADGFRHLDVELNGVLIRRFTKSRNVDSFDIPIMLEPGENNLEFISQGNVVTLAFGDLQ